MAQQRVCEDASTATLALEGLLWLMPSYIDTVTSVLRAETGWSVDQHVSYDGTVVTMATQDHTGQVFTLSGSGGRVTLTQMDDDQMVQCGSFADMPSALERVTMLAREQP